MPNSDYALGLPEKGVYGDLSKLTPGQLVTYALQEHSTDRQRGRSHYDLRLGTPETGLFSWAVPKAKLPSLKDKLLAVRTELHRYGYGGFKGRIGSGYGAGTVRQADYGDAVIHSQSPRSIQFTIAHAKVPARYRLMHVKDDKWILTNTTPQGVDIPEMKPTFKLITEAELPNVMEHAKEMQAKIDGALGIFHIGPQGRMEAYSPRRRVTGEPISYSERLGLGQESHPELADTVLRGEVYGEKQGASIPWLFSKPDVVVPGAGPHTLITGLSGSGKTTDMLENFDGKKVEVDNFFPLSTDESVDDNDLAWKQTLQFEPKLEKILRKKQPSIIEGVQLPIFRKVPGAMDQTWRIKRTSLIKSTLRKWLRDRKHPDNRYSLSLLQSLKGNLANKKMLDETLAAVSQSEDGEKQAQAAIPFNELSGLMNANLNKAIPAVQARKLALKAALFDVVRYKGMDVSSMPYEQRKALLMKIIGHLPPSKFTLPESASTPEGMQDLIERIRSGKHPMTQEGVVIDNKYKYKIRPDSTGYITGTFPGTGKRQSTAGGILYTDKPGGTDPVGKIGTGFTDAELQEIASGLGGLMGRPFRFTHRGQTASGNYREPSWAGWETDKPDIKAAADPDGSFVAGAKLSLEEEYDPYKSVNMVNGKKVVNVSGNKVKLKHDMDFVEGGNGQAYDYVPDGQVWIDKAISPRERKFIALHELVEERLMRNKGMSYEKAHSKANVAEKAYRQEVKKALVELGAIMKSSTMNKEVPGDAVPLSICTPDGKVKTTVDTEMADTPAKAAKGLSGRKTMSEKAAMLFTTTGPFWMKGCHFDVDLVFLDKEGQVTSFGTMPKGSPNLFYPDPMAKLALEVKGGICQKIGLQRGDKVQIPKG